CQQYADFLPTF
nr:immunoglobulin light chain junction region [Macaca mulatta]MOV34613.1 immunoglobulin light chain junction region [Macaca mulatta]MOV35277.1 immunoglobulin light chain junction region [Macaca mulatta]MOV35340.1 immunoglobulin light chain junction region [Macaca mulatta]